MTLNPFTIKELRQLTRSRTIAGALICYLFLCVGVCYAVPLFGLGYKTGGDVFAWLVIMLSVASAIVVPSGIFMSMLAERRGRLTSDMTLMTALPPSGMVDGKLRAGYALIGLFASATLPSAIFANLMRGINWTNMGTSLTIALSMSFLALHGAVLIGAMRVSGAVKSVAFIVLMFALMSMFPLCSSPTMIRGWDGNLLLMIVGISASAGLIARSLSVFLVSPATAERDLQLRVTSIAIAVAWLVVTLTASILNPYQSGSYLKSFSWTFATLAAVLAIVATGLGVGYSRRMIAGFSGPLPKRLLRWPFSSGAANAYTFAIAYGCAAALVLPLAKPFMIALRRSIGDDKPEWGFYGSLTPVTVFMYIMSVLLFWRAIWRFASRFARISPALVVFMTGCVVALIQSLPHLLSLGPDMTPDEFSRMPFFFAGVAEYPMRHLCMASGALAFSVLLNSVALFKALKAELFANVRRPARAAAVAALALCAAVLPRTAECAPSVQLPAMLQMLPSMPDIPEVPKAALLALKESGASLNLTLWAMQLAVMKKDEIAVRSREIGNAATEAAAAKDDNARNAAWKKLEAAERGLFSMLDLRLNGMTLTLADKLTAKKTYWRVAAAEIEKHEPSMTDPAAKKFFAAKKTIYKKKASVGMANKKAGKR
ncbi:MAG: hypothetical protein E7049_10440 [Lentisphaerae bacterium]|nr:hypothetical protein [Lentisphaerota bacterium]